jgi:hypothetical protein
VPSDDEANRDNHGDNRRDQEHDVRGSLETPHDGCARALRGDVSI